MGSNAKIGRNPAHSRYPASMSCAPRGSTSLSMRAPWAFAAWAAMATTTASVLNGTWMAARCSPIQVFSSTLPHRDGATSSVRRHFITPFA